MSVSTDRAWSVLRLARRALDEELTVKVGDFIEDQKVEEANPDGRSDAELRRHLSERSDALAEQAVGLLDRMRAEIKKNVDDVIAFGRTYATSDQPADLAVEQMATLAIASALARGVSESDAAAGVVQAYGVHGWRAGRRFFVPLLADWSEAERADFGRRLDELIAEHPSAPEPLAEGMKLREARDALLAALDTREEWVRKALDGTAGAPDLLTIGVTEAATLTALDPEPASEAV